MQPNMPAGLVTHSGVFVPNGAIGPVPSLDDIVLSLSRLPRFGGHCRRPWSVLQHSLFVHELLRDYVREKRWLPNYETDAQSLRLSGLLHDAHEALTGDIPTHFKAFAQQLMQVKLDGRIWGRFHPGGVLAHDVDAYRVQQADARALRAEALLVGPPPLASVNMVEKYFGAAPDDMAVATLKRVLGDPLYSGRKGAAWLFRAFADQCGVVE